MTTRRKSSVPTLRITQVHSIIGNQERVKRVVTSGLGLGRIGSSVVLPDNPYTRGMIAKAAHIVRFDEVPAEAHGGKAEAAHAAVPEAVEKLVEAAVAPAVAPAEKAPRAKKAEGEPKAKPTKAAAKPAKPAKPAGSAPRKRAPAKGKE